MKLALTSGVFPRSSCGSRHRALMSTSASYCSLSVSISPIFRNTTETSTLTCNTMRESYQFKFSINGYRKRGAMGLVGMFPIKILQFSESIIDKALSNAGQWLDRYWHIKIHCDPLYQLRWTIHLREPLRGASNVMEYLKTTVNQTSFL